jgi:tRNA nucleotidyltransferase/poly(A) polymerase
LAGIDTAAQRQFAVEVVRRLRERGFTAYWAGGCVRDELLGFTPKDYDVATDAAPQQVVDLFGHRRTLQIGAAFGVVAVRGGRGAGQVEVATFRRDESYSDGRRPDAVTFSSADEDAHRRDFTINGLFYDPLDERVIDYVGGLDDLRRGCVRAIGEPRQRFTEDRLRMLRCVRISAAFGFAIDPPTFEAVRGMAPQVVVVSAERITDELRKMFECPRRALALALLHESGLLAAVLPETAALWAPSGANGAAESPEWRYTLDVVERLREPRLPLVLAALLHRAAPGDNDSVRAAASARVAGSVGRRWRLSSRELELACYLIREQASLAGAPEQSWPRLQRRLIHRDIETLLALCEAIASASAQPTRDVEFCREILARPRSGWDPPPLVTGTDLLALGVMPGPSYKRLLDLVRDAQLEGRVTDRPQALALLARLAAEEPPPGHEA